MWILISKHYSLTLKSCGDWSVFLSVGVMCPCKRECIALGDGPSLLGMFSCFLLTIGSFGVWKTILDEAGKSLISRWREGTCTYMYIRTCIWLPTCIKWSLWRFFNGNHPCRILHLVLGPEVLMEKTTIMISHLKSMLLLKTGRACMYIHNIFMYMYICIHVHLSLTCRKIYLSLCSLNLR